MDDGGRVFTGQLEHCKAQYCTSPALQAGGCGGGEGGAGVRCNISQPLERLVLVNAAIHKACIYPLIVTHRRGVYCRRM